MESLLLRRTLELLLERMASMLHARFHMRFAPGPCQAPALPLADSRWSDPAMPWQESLDRWHEKYAAWFDGHHAMPVAIQVQRLLQERFAEPLTLPALARMAGSSRTTLIGQFTRVFGIGPVEYRARIQIRDALRRLRASHASIDDVAVAVGYQAASKFYGRLRRYTGLTPAQVRQLPEREFEQLMSTRLSLRQPAEC
jgi:AraC-like DNA-binding protein